MIEVAENIFIENNFPICNLGLIDTGDGLVMVDTPLNPTYALKWRDIIARKGKLKYVITTEPHGDHCGNSCFFDAVLISHTNSRDILSKSQKEITEFVHSSDPSATGLMTKHWVRLADITFDKTIIIHLGKLSFHLLYLPGHTPSNIAVYIPERRVLFAADNIIFHGKTWLHESLPYQWLESLKILSALDVDIVVPGHSGEKMFCGKEYFAEQSSIIEQWITVTKLAIKRGLTVEEAAQQIICPDPYHILGMSIMTESDLNKMIIRRLYEVL